ncbi:CcoQ/FixQ family Cbb3-type cytochrome c oxidase assembly chaperone [Bordetella genomosp. 7]|jgi:cytochrome c oxidase cbb3-type subunit 4|uniref:CcoQ/FixQ family Cbb3-type cytochrome c oxidase assembly chaperone n=1 Tax=Bordetella genomosp. 7 TaxID=1416805 RepID=A0A261QYA6_9BORD|nr:MULTISPECIES: cytochrome oxidase [Bordetella]OZI17744.1 CcoQ/FixQ family Cbb3-type cytochrome c oxidase assembly chaperone [Bordetella genomosp. 7]OZI22255.1 CcoQ/FixQ family Cbb3-type cytochrome c oxidase assembly chaperone [Bordetella genomosp. 7]
MLIITGIMTAISMATFLGIVWWAYSRGRQRANQESALLPFALPDETGPAKGATRP